MIRRPLLSALTCLVPCLFAMGLVPSRAWAEAITNTPDPFLGTSLTLTSATPFDTPPFGYTNTLTITNFVQTSDTIVGGNSVMHYTAEFDTTFYTDSTLTTPTGSIALQGEFDVTVMNRVNSYSTGTYNYTVNLATFSGVVGGQSLTTSLDPSQISQGTTTITAGPLVGEYTINSPATVFAGYSVNGGAFTDVPTLSASSMTAVPEPSSLILMGTSVIGGLVFLRRKNVI